MIARSSILRLTLRLYPLSYREERAEEMLTTALEASAGSRTSVLRESVSLVLGGISTRARLAARKPLRDAVRGAALLCAWGLAIVNVAVAIAGLTARVHLHGGPVFGVYLGPSYGPYALDWWWIGFAGASAALMVALALGWRLLADVAAVASALLVGYDAVFLADGDKYDGRGHFDLFTYTQTSSFPGGREWAAAGLVLAVATIVGLDGRVRAAHPLRLLMAVATAVGLALVAHEAWGAFFYLRWPLVVLLLISSLFGWLEPRLPLATAGFVFAALPSVVSYLTASNLPHDTRTTVSVVLALSLGTAYPLLYALARARAARS
jgi:hypothetical protein